MRTYRFPDARKLIFPLIKLPLRSGAWIFYLALVLIEPVRRIRIGIIRHDRIGHLSLNTEIFLRSLAIGKEDQNCSYLILSDVPINRQIATMIKRRLTVLEFPGMDKFFNAILAPVFRGTRFFADIGKSQHYTYDELSKIGPQLSFTIEEEARGKRLFNDIGIPSGSPFICFHSRDEVYLERKVDAGRDWSYHHYRDCDIENYLPAVERLAERGLYALRMGDLVAKPLTLKNPRIVDYATHHRSDFGDIYLLTHCKFFLANTAGLNCVPVAFNVPVAFANLIPLGYPPWHKHDIFIPKIHRDKVTGRLLTFPQIMALGACDWLDGRKFAEAGIDLIENTSDEIMGLAEEMDARIDGNWKQEPEDEELQRLYWSLFPKTHPAAACPTRVGASFLRKYRDLLR